MNQYTLYDTATGAISGGGCTDTDGFPLNEGEGLHVGETLSARTHWFDGNAPVAYTDAECAALAARPPYLARWDVPTKAWVDTRTIDQVRADKWNEIKAARDVAEYGGFVWDGSTFDSDETSQRRLQGAVLLVQIAQQPIDWTLSDNSVRTLSAQDVVAVGEAMGQLVQSAHAKSRALRVQIDQAATMEEVMAISW
jgi:hypothetical protein